MTLKPWIAVALFSVMFAFPGHAWGESTPPAGSPVISSPTSGVFFRTGWSGPITVDLTDAAYGTYTTDIKCGATDSSGQPTGEDTYAWSATFDHDGTQTSKSWTVPAFTGHKSECHLTVDDGNGHAAASTFYMWGLPEISAPVADATVPVDWKGPVTVNLLNVEAGYYSASLQCAPASGGGAQVIWQSNTIAYDGSQTSYSYNLSASPVPGSCLVRVHNTAGTVIASSPFTVMTGSFTQGPSASITGTAQVGSTLTAGAGAPVPSPDSLAYQWLADGAVIGGATASTLPLTAEQVGKRIKVTVTAVKSRYADASDTSPETDPVAIATFTMASGPSITGSPKVGVKLTASNGSWTPAPTSFSHQWLANGAAIVGATGSTYTPNDAVVGKRISVRVTASKAGYTSKSATSIQTPTVAATPIAITDLDPVQGYFYPNIKDGNRDVETVNFRFNRSASYRFRVVDSAGSVVRLSPVTSGQQGQWNWDGRKSDGTLAPVGLYRVRLTASAGGHTVSQTSDGFYLKPGPVVVTSFSRQLGYFYPYIKDGNRDYQPVSYSFNRSLAYRIQVINESGSVVRQTPVWSGSSGQWEWDGRKSDGTLAPNGKYRMRVRASAGGQTVTRTSETFYLKSGYTWQFIDRVTKNGDNGSPSTSGPCYITRNPTYWDPYLYYDPYAYDPDTGEYDGYWVGGYVAGDAEIDCWGGTGVMNYNFPVPSNAGKFAWSVSGETSGADICCDGSITKSGTRPSSTTYRVSVKVTGTRAWIVDGVTLAYYKKKYY